MTTFKVFGSDGDTFCRPLGEDDSRSHAMALAREHHENGEDVQVIRITDSVLEFVEATGYRGEPLMEH